MVLDDAVGGSGSRLRQDPAGFEGLEGFEAFFARVDFDFDRSDIEVERVEVEVKVVEVESARTHPP